ncbi:unnamed protein product, partial [Sphacelaria rigidula]
NAYIALAANARFLKAEVIEIMIHDCVSQTFSTYQPVAQSPPRVTAEVPQRPHLHAQRPPLRHDACRQVLERSGGDCIEATRIEANLTICRPRRAQARQAPPRHRHA